MRRMESKRKIEKETDRCHSSCLCLISFGNSKIIEHLFNCEFDFRSVYISSSQQVVIMGILSLLVIDIEKNKWLFDLISYTIASIVNFILHSATLPGKIHLL